MSTENPATKYYALYKDGSYIEKDTFDELVIYSDAVAFLRYEYHHHNISNFMSNRFDFFQFIPIDLNQEKTTIKYSERFEIKDIGAEEWEYNNQGGKDSFVITYFDYSTKRLNKFRTKSNGIQAFTNDIFPYFRKKKSSEIESGNQIEISNLKEKLTDIEIKMINIENMVRQILEKLK